MVICVWCFQMSKEATLTDAVDYIQELERQKEELQKELKEMAEDDVEKQGSASSSGAMVEHPEPVQCKARVLDPLDPPPPRKTSGLILSCP